MNHPSSTGRLLDHLLWKWNTILFLPRVEGGIDHRQEVNSLIGTCIRTMAFQHGWSSLPMVGGKKSCANLNLGDLIVRSMAKEDFQSISPRWSVKPLGLEEMKKVMTRWQVELEGRGWPSLYLTSRNCSKGGTQPFEKFSGFRRAVFSRGNHFRLSRRHRSIQAKYRAN